MGEGWGEGDGTAERSEPLTLDERLCVDYFPAKRNAWSTTSSPDRLAPGREKLRRHRPGLPSPTSLLSAFVTGSTQGLVVVKNTSSAV